MSEAAIQPTPVSLLQQLRRAEPHQVNRAWRRFVLFYTPLLLLWTRRLGVEPSEADDLVQDVFAVLIRELPAFHYDANQRFRGWLWTILANKWRDRLRQRAAGPTLTDAGALETVAAPDDLEAFTQEEYRAYLIARALEVMQAELPARDLQACRAYMVEGRPAAEVAGELAMSVNQVYLAKSRMLRLLRLELEGLLD
jgi:RNA polymerase sigma-70 factor (ECF subfamily)